MPRSDFVLSVPAGYSYDLILEHFIYSCPDDSRYPYDETEWITFRKADGTMERIFKIDRVVSLVPVDIEASHEAVADLRNRIAGYLSVARNKKRVIEEPGKRYRFYFLKEDDVIELPHRPHTEPRREGAIYFELSELKGGRTIVKPVR